MKRPTFDKCEQFAYTSFMNLQKDLIRNKGLRVTPARLAVLNVLTEAQKPLDIASIWERISRKRVDADQATIYRIIENFIQKDLISRLQFQEKKFFYEAKREEHHHAICKNCGKIEDVSKCNIKRLEKEIDESIGFRVESHSLEFYGTCRGCQ